MKLRLAICLLALIVVTACNKDKFTTEPQVKAKSITPSTVEQGNIIRFRSKFTDKEGDLDSALIVYKWYNGAAVTMKDTFRYSLSSLGIPTKTTDGDMNIEFSYGRILQGYVQLSSVIRDTTSTLGVILIDKEAHRSNYAESDPIRLKKP
jgi:hypothetical protein